MGLATLSRQSSYRKTIRNFKSRNTRYNGKDHQKFKSSKSSHARKSVNLPVKVRKSISAMPVSKLKSRMLQRHGTLVWGAVFVEERVYQDVFGQDFRSQFGHQSLSLLKSDGPSVQDKSIIRSVDVASRAVPRRRATICGSLLWMKERPLLPEYGYMWALHEAIVAKELDPRSSRHLPMLKKIAPCDFEFGRCFKEDLETFLKNKYDPKRIADPSLNNFYYFKNLLRRESMQWNPTIHSLLSILWDARGSGKSNLFGKAEYLVMHEMLCYHLRFVDSRGNISEEMRKNARRDWAMDSQGHTWLNKERFFCSIFQLVDKHTATIDAEEYIAYLQDLVGFLTELDPATGRIRWRPIDFLRSLHIFTSVRAARKIQRAWRQAFPNRTLLAVVKIQKWFRRFRRFSSTERASLQKIARIVKKFREYLKRRNREEVAARRIAHWTAVAIARMKLRMQIRSRRLAALQIQVQWREFLQRKLEKKKEEKLLQVLKTAQGVLDNHHRKPSGLVSQCKHCGGVQCVCSLNEFGNMKHKKRVKVKVGAGPNPFRGSLKLVKRSVDSVNANRRHSISDTGLDITGLMDITARTSFNNLFENHTCGLPMHEPDAEQSIPTEIPPPVQVIPSSMSFNRNPPPSPAEESKVNHGIASDETSMPDMTVA